MKFTKAADMSAQIREDLVGRTFPHLLTHLATAVRLKTQLAFLSVAKKLDGTPPALFMSVSSVPAPGTAKVSSLFHASVDPQGNEKTFAEADEYKKAFREVFDNLDGKSALLKLLSSVGVS